jgi:hypothetical protein
MAQGLQIEILDATAAKQYLEDLARLRMTVFRDFPYLYDGNLHFERKYLETYFQSKGARVVLCRDGNKVVGASAVIPLKDEDEALKNPFIQAGHNIDEIMYFGESVLLSDYRGRGAGKIFFQERIKHAQNTKGIKHAAFCAVQRPSDHPLRPKNHLPLDGLWQSFGFQPVPGLTCSMSWKQIDESNESPKTLQFWMRDI